MIKELQEYNTTDVRIDQLINLGTREANFHGNWCPPRYARLKSITILCVGNSVENILTRTFLVAID